MAVDSRLLDSDSRDKAINTIASHVEDALLIRNQMEGGRSRVLSCITCSRSSGSAVTVLYLCIKSDFYATSKQPEILKFQFYSSILPKCHRPDLSAQQLYGKPKSPVRLVCLK